jgi:hypothetical protein
MAAAVKPVTIVLRESIFGWGNNCPFYGKRGQLQAPRTCC